MAVSKSLVQLPTKPHALYRFYDRTDALLYIGISMDLPARMNKHRKGKPWWSAADHITVEHFDTREEARAAETEAIANEGPLYNVAHNQMAQAPAETRTAHEFADVMLRHLAEGPEALDAFLRKAEGHVREAGNDPEDDLAGADPTQYAAELAADEAVMDRHALNEGFGYLLSHLPQDRVRRCRARARDELQGRLGATEAFIMQQTAFYIAAEFATDYIESLPESERAVWRRAAVNMFRSEIEPELIDFHAARYARAHKAGEPHRYGKAIHLCHAPTDDGLACPEALEFNVIFRDCELCPGAERCKGHNLWCKEHMSRGLATPYTWNATDRPAIVCNYSAVELDDPWSIGEPPF